MAKTGLGRGLGALLGEQPAAAPQESAPEAASDSVRRISLGKIQPCPVQPRREFNRLALEELAQSIKANGIVQPLITRPVDDHFELIAGERRWRAADIAGLSDVPVVVREATDAEVLEMALIENLQREDLNPIEEAQGFQNLIDIHQYTQKQAAARVGRSRAAVANALRLLKLDEDVQVYVRQGRLSMGHAKVILGLEDAAQQKLATEHVLKNGLSVRATEELTGQMQRGGKGTSAKPNGKAIPDAHVTSLQNKLTEQLGTKVSLNYRKGKGAVKIQFYSDEDLVRILSLLGIDSD
jgi:ParB family chromosome partitioning protein